MKILDSTQVRFNAALRERMIHIELKPPGYILDDSTVPAQAETYETRGKGNGRSDIRKIIVRPGLGVVEVEGAEIYQVLHLKDLNPKNFHEQSVALGRQAGDGNGIPDQILFKGISARVAIKRVKNMHLAASLVSCLNRLDGTSPVPDHLIISEPPQHPFYKIDYTKSLERFQIIARDKKSFLEMTYLGAHTLYQTGEENYQFPSGGGRGVTDVERLRILIEGNANE